MKLTTKSTIYSISGFLIGLTFFLLILKFYEASDTKKLIVSFIALFITILIFNRVSEYFINKHIKTSPNPRREYWRLFLKNHIGHDQLNNIPDSTEFIEKFSPEYCFFDKGSSKKIRFYICGKLIRFQNVFGKFTSYSFSDINEIFIQYKILLGGDSADIPMLNIIIRLNNKKVDVCDIRKINCNIDELEQIIKYFAKEKYRITTNSPLKID